MDPTKHAVVLELEKQRYHSRPCSSCNVVDELAGQIAVDREPVCYWQAEQIPWKHERPKRDEKVDNTGPRQLGIQIKLPNTVAVDEPLPGMALQLPNSNVSYPSTSSSTTSANIAPFFCMCLTTTHLTSCHNLVREQFCVLLINQYTANLP